MQFIILNIIKNNNKNRVSKSYMLLWTQYFARKRSFFFVIPALVPP